MVTGQLRVVVPVSKLGPKSQVNGLKSKVVSDNRS